MLLSVLVWLGREHHLLCELSKEQDGRCALFGVRLRPHLDLFYHILCASSSPAILYVRAVNKCAPSVYRVLAEFMFRLARNQAVARIADRTASQHLWGSRDVISHVTI